MVTGSSWVLVPETLRFNLTGALTNGATARDLILTIIGKIGANGANYHAMEFAGPGMASLTMSDRIAICNLCVEAGAKTALMEVDDITFDYLAAHGGREPEACFSSDPDAKFEKVYDIDLSTIVPVLAKPHFVDNIAPVSECKGIKINEAFLGSCNNGRLEDLAAAAEILKGKKIAPFVKMIVTPASRKIYREALEAGILETLAEAGAMITHPCCGLCCGRAGGILTDNEVVVATNNRNFLGRMGTSKVQIYLASPKTAAWTALTGKITLPE